MKDLVPILDTLEPQEIFLTHALNPIVVLTPAKKEQLGTWNYHAPSIRLVTTLDHTLEQREILIIHAPLKTIVVLTPAKKEQLGTWNYHAPSIRLVTTLDTLEQREIF